MQANFITKIPKFERFGLITSESLNLISFNLFNFINAKYIDSSEGVIAGFDVTYDKNKKAFCIGKGILKINENIFFSNEGIYIDTPKQEGRYYCILEFTSNKNENYFENILEVKLISQKEYKEEFILFEIILREGADIVEDNNHFEEFRDEFNTINIINQKYCATYSKYSTISPKIMKKWASVASCKMKIETIDLNFIFLCLNSIVSRELLLAYIKEKLNINLDICNVTNNEIVKYLSCVLRTKIKENDEDNKQSEEYFYIN